MKDQNAKTEEDFAVEDLLKRGWTRTLIDHFLGREDYRNPVNHFRNYSGKKVFIRRRVELVEASREFECSFTASAKRRKMSEAAVDEVCARIAELRANRDQLRESNIRVPSKEELTLRAVADLFSQARALGYRTPHKC
jgi:hypothetical protein